MHLTKVFIPALALPALAYGSPVKVGGTSVKCPKVTAPSVPTPNKLDCVLAAAELALDGLFETSASATVNTCTISYDASSVASITGSILKTAISAISSACQTLNGIYVPVPGVSVTVGASASA